MFVLFMTKCVVRNMWALAGSVAALGRGRVLLLEAYLSVAYKELFLIVRERYHCN